MAGLIVAERIVTRRTRGKTSLNEAILIFLRQLGIELEIVYVLMFLEKNWVNGCNIYRWSKGPEEAQKSYFSGKCEGLRIIFVE